jgi:hypothetical protein
MSERSELLKKVLDTWERSEEGREYLEWLLQPESAHLDGGDVLREAVLDATENDAQLRTLRHQRAKKAFSQFCADHPEVDTPDFREMNEKLLSAMQLMAEHKVAKGKVEFLRTLRRALDCDRLEALRLFTQLMQARERELPEVDDIIAACGGIPESTDPKECEPWARKFNEAGGMEAFHRDFKRKFGAMEEVQARIAALSRTSVEPVDAEAEWQKLADDEHSFQQWQEVGQKSAEGLVDRTAEGLDRYFSHQVVARLKKIVKRASTLEPVPLNVSNTPVRILFQQAHGAYLYGFNIASIALCRSLIEAALRNRLSVSSDKNIKLLGKPGEDSLINRAAEAKLLGESERIAASNVARLGNDVMHNVSSIQSHQTAAEETLVFTRKVLNKLYGDAAEAATG